MPPALTGSMLSHAAQAASFNKRLQLTAFGARDHAFFLSYLVPRLGGSSTSVDVDMSQILATTRNRIEAQGFLCFDDRTLTEINYWLRLSPAICMVWAAIGTALNSASILRALVPFALLGAALRGHPFDVLYTYGFQYLVHGPRVPRYPLPGRFACLIATMMLAVSAWGVSAGKSRSRSHNRLASRCGCIGQRQYGFLHPFLHLRTNLRQAIGLREKGAISMIALCEHGHRARRC
jgi:hypothetical protein